MTDYLEWKQEEKADALWEAVRRLEEQAAAVTTGKPRQNSGPEGDAWARTADVPSEYAVEQGERHLLRAEGQDTGIWPVRREDRALYESGLARFSPEQSEGADGRPDRLPTGRNRREAAEQGEMGQAERLDRIFRRDGRRYDGGFFLY